MTKLLKIGCYGLLISGLLNLCSTSLLSFQPGHYIGLGVEYQNFGGNRKDSTSSRISQFDYVPKQHFHNDKMGFEVFGGYLFPFCSDCFLIGYEGYLAWCFNKHTASGMLNNETFTSSFKRKFNAGILFKGGAIICEDYFIYGLIGPDVGWFKWTQSAESFKQSKEQALVGIRFGAGIEREFSCCRVGFQVDYTHYNSKTFSAANPDGDSFTSYFKPNILNVGLRLSLPLN